LRRLWSNVGACALNFVLSLPAVFSLLHFFFNKSFLLFVFVVFCDVSLEHQ